MKAFRPRSFLNLVLLGFIVVSLPLGVGLWTTITYLDRVTGAGLAVVDHAVNGTRDSEILSEYLRNEERTLRLFSVTKERQYLNKAEQYHSKTDTLLYDLLGLPLQPQVRRDLEEMRRARNSQRAVMISLRTAEADPEWETKLESAINSFAVQYEQAEQVRNGFHEMINQEIVDLHRTNEEARRILISQTGAFILATIAIIGVMAFLLSWPVRQLNKSVERLGNGDFKTPVNVSGPLDIEAVGSKLDWLRKRLDALEQEKAKFLAHISHELKTPLASIREGAALLNEGLVGELNEKQLDVAAILVNNSVVLQQLIENIINFNMAQLGQKSQEKTTIELQGLIQKVLDTQTTQLMSRNIRLDIKLEAATVYGDRKELETIFENLFSNAVKFSPSGGVVGCRMRTDGSTIACLVYDEGPGVPYEEREKIFQPFYQIETPEHSMVKGSGLGLAIVREYARHHGGSVTVLNPGKAGARIGLRLPLARSGRREGGAKQ